MSTTMLRRIDQIRFETPLAVLFGLSAAFAAFAMPADPLGIFPGAAAMPFGKTLLALISGGALGAGAYVAMKLAGAMPHPSIWEPDLAVEEDDDEEEGESAERIRTRRADRHPDAPTREPIFASRDLGQPFMDVGTAPRRGDEQPVEEIAPPSWLARELVAEPAPAIDPAVVEEDDFALDAPVYAEPRDGDPWLTPTLDAETEAHDATPHAADEAETGADDIDAPIAAFAPAEEPAPQPARVARPSISALMERLSSGVDRRGGDAPARFSADEVSEAYGRPRTGGEDLRKALDELNRLAARRG